MGHNNVNKYHNQESTEYSVSASVPADSADFWAFGFGFGQIWLNLAEFQIDNKTGKVNQFVKILSILISDLQSGISK